MLEQTGGLQINLIGPFSLAGIGTAIVCSFIIGFERQIRGKPAGIRTSILICLGSYIFVRLAVSLSNDDYDALRIIGPVATGIGFLGAGVMFSQEGTVSGVTSAAVIWLLAGIGSIVGAGHNSAALLITLISVLILIGVEVTEALSRPHRRGAHAKEDDGTTHRSGGESIRRGKRLPLPFPIHARGRRMRARRISTAERGRE